MELNLQKVKSFQEDKLKSIIDEVFQVKEVKCSDEALNRESKLCKDDINQGKELKSYKDQEEIISNQDQVEKLNLCQDMTVLGEKLQCHLNQASVGEDIQSYQELSDKLQQCKDELEKTKKKLERTERQLDKSNDYNSALRSMVEKLSSELHSLKHAKSISVHVQVDREDFLRYTTGANTMPVWTTDDHLAIPMKINGTTDYNNTSHSYVEPAKNHGATQHVPVSIADSLKEAAEAVIQEQRTQELLNQGYVFDETSSLYYHPLSGYYYDADKQLFYDSYSGTYYYYDYLTNEYKVHMTMDTEYVESINKVNRSRKERRKANMEMDKSYKKRNFRESHSSRQTALGRKPKCMRRHESYSSKNSQGRTGSEDNRRRSLSRENIKVRRKVDCKHPSLDEKRIHASRKKNSKNRDDQRKSRMVKKGKNVVDKEKVEIEKADNNVEQEILQLLNAEDKVVKRCCASELRQSDKRAMLDDIVIDVDELESEGELLINGDDDEISKPNITNLDESVGEHYYVAGSINSEDRITDEGLLDNNKDHVQHFHINCENVIKNDHSTKSQHFSISQACDNSCNRSRTHKHRHSVQTETLSSSERESGEITDMDTSEDSSSHDNSSYDSSSYSSCSFSESDDDMSDGDDLQLSVDLTTDQELVTTWPPCIRMIVTESEYLDVGTLNIVTCTGASIGRGNCHITIPDINISKIHASIHYDVNYKKYAITDEGSQNGTFINGCRLSEANKISEPFTISHRDTVQIGSSLLLCHIHPGTETCDECEPGVVMAKYKSQTKTNTVTETKVLTKEERKKQARQALNQIKKKYGLKNAAYEDNHIFKNANYVDKAAERRNTVGTDVPGQKQQPPASVYIPISSNNVGHKILQKMGWKEGDMLGKNNAGIQEPIVVTLRTDQKAGLGSANSSSVSADDVDSESLKKASRRAQAQHRYNQIHGDSEEHVEIKWTKGDTLLPLT